MLSLPHLEPLDSHTLWLPQSQRPRRSGAHHTSHTNSSSNPHLRRNAQTRAPQAPVSSDSLANLASEERALRLRKQNIALFGYSWIRPAGFPKTMQGVREEEAEREEAVNVADGDVEFTGDGALDGATGAMIVDDPEAAAAMERDLDDEIPDADETGGLIEDGEGGIEEDDFEEDALDEEELMERDLDDDIPDGFDVNDDDDELDEDDDFDEQPNLDDDIPDGSAFEADDSMMERDLDAEIPDGQSDPAEVQDWEHTDTDADDDEDEGNSFVNDSRLDNTLDTQFHQQSSNLRSSISTRAGRSPRPPPVIRHRETEAQRLFLDRWSGGMPDDVEDSMAAFRSSGISEANVRIPRVRTRRRIRLSDDSDDLE